MLHITYSAQVPMHVARAGSEGRGQWEGWEMRTSARNQRTPWLLWAVVLG